MLITVCSLEVCLNSSIGMKKILQTNFNYGRKDNARERELLCYQIEKLVKEFEIEK